MKPLIVGLTLVAIVACAQPVRAAAAASHGPAKPSSYAPQKPNASRVYGAPIQPPIVQRVHRPRKGAHQALKPEAAAQRKAKAATAARKSRASEGYRHAHPAAVGAHP